MVTLGRYRADEVCHGKGGIGSVLFGCNAAIVSGFAAVHPLAFSFATGPILAKGVFKRYRGACLCV